MSERIVYRHPKGRFEVHETVGHSALGGTYRIREAFLTPEKDERGRLTNADKLAEVPDALPPEPPTVRTFNRMSQKEQQKICTMWRQGFSIAQIAQAIGRAKNTVNVYLVRKGLRERNERNLMTEEEINTAADLWRRGYTLRAIGEALGRSKNTVNAALKRLAKQTG